MARLTSLLLAAGFAAVLALSGGDHGVDLPWSPTFGLRLHLELDGIGVLYGLLATGIGAVVVAYSSAYLPRHLAHQDRPASEQLRFYALLALFAVSMVGLATAQDLILIFLFWDLTAVASYFLIGYDRHERASRSGALMALLVTGVTAVLLLIGALVLRAEYGTLQLPELAERAQPGAAVTLAGALIAIAGLAKSAQVPLHFWLPRAMAAPSPVSAYLHSAAMVAAGVLLLGRTYPVLSLSEEVTTGLVATGLASIAVGGVLALTADGMKELLARSTISQYGYVTFLLGLGGPKGALAASFYVLAHAPAKCALFLVSGAVTEATGGRTRLSQLGGLAREQPALAVAGGVAAAGLAALPLTAGFFKDELLFAAAAGEGTVWALCAVGAAVLTFTYAGRWWIGIFLGRRRADAARLPLALVGAPLLLAAVVVAGGLVPGPLVNVAEQAATATLADPVAGAAAYHLDLRAENVMALAAYAGGALLLLSRPLWTPAATAFARLGTAAGPERGYHAGLHGLNRLSDALHDIEVRDLRGRVAAVLVPAAALMALAIAFTPLGGTYFAGAVEADDVPLILALVACAIAAITTTIPRDHVMMVLAAAATGLTLVVAYALLGGADVALVAVVVEGILSLLLIGVLALVPSDVLRREAALRSTRTRRARDVIVAGTGALVAFLLVWSALSRPTPPNGVAETQLELTDDAHAEATVTAILADFRGLDTLVEITVVLVAAMAAGALLRRGARE